MNLYNSFTNTINAGGILSTINESFQGLNDNEDEVLSETINNSSKEMLPIIKKIISRAKPKTYEEIKARSLKKLWKELKFSFHVPDMKEVTNDFPSIEILEWFYTSSEISKEEKSKIQSLISFITKEVNLSLNEFDNFLKKKNITVLINTAHINLKK